LASRRNFTLAALGRRLSMTTDEIMALTRGES